MNEENIIKKNKTFTIENLLCFFIVTCPILDVVSFIFRNYFNTNISISTFIRPIIPIIGMVYIFFKGKLKPQLLGTVGIYVVYSLCHLYIFHVIKKGCSYGNELREAQYLINYTFMIMELFIYWYFFAYRNREKEVKDEEKGTAIAKLKKCVLIALTIYVALMYLALITRTSSFTYPEDQIGYKGWFESGNSIGTIMLLSLFVVLPMTSKNNKLSIRIWSFMITVLTGAYLTTLLGTRTGLFGFIIVLVVYAGLNILYGIIHSKKLNKKAIIAILIACVIVGMAVITFGSMTLQRRKNLQDKESEIYDDMTGQSAHVTGDMVKIIKQIKEGTLDTDYMSEDEQKTMLDLYDMANKQDVSGTDSRALQFIYHSRLVKNQNNIPMLLFGNGYMTHFYELIFEMEVPAFLYNFGVIGFFLYFMPFLAIAVYGIYSIIKNIKEISVEFAMCVLGIWFAIITSFLSGYTFFNASSMMMIVALCIFVVNNIKDLEDNQIKIYGGKEDA